MCGAVKALAFNLSTLLSKEKPLYPAVKHLFHTTNETSSEIEEYDI